MRSAASAAVSFPAATTKATSLAGNGHLLHKQERARRAHGLNSNARGRLPTTSSEATVAVERGSGVASVGKGGKCEFSAAAEDSADFHRSGRLLATSPRSTPSGPRRSRCANSLPSLRSLRNRQTSPKRPLARSVIRMGGAPSFRADSGPSLRLHANGATSPNRTFSVRTGSPRTAERDLRPAAA